MTETDDFLDSSEVQLTALQHAVVEEFLEVQDPYKAAINAGYSEKAARSFANRFKQITKILDTIDANKRVEKELMTTWQPVAAIAARSGVPIRATLSILVRLYNTGRVRMSYSRIDGHNKVHMFKKLETQKILGVFMPVETGEVEL